MESRNSEIRIVLFDIGGVLVELSGVTTTLAWMGGTLLPQELWKRWLTSPATRAFETGKTTPEIFAEQVIAELALPVNSNEFLREFTYWPRGLFPGALELVARIPKHYTRATLSNTNALHWPRCMKEMHLAEAFDHHFASHLTGKVKPDEAAFEFVIRALNCAPKEILFLDDNELNVDAARRIGIRAFQVNGVAGSEEALIRNRVLQN